jgi:hypothetical protein
VGWVGGTTGIQAALWNGDAGSFVNLTPKGYTSAQAMATNGTDQVGVLNGVVAVVWHESADRYDDLSALTTGMTQTRAFAIDSAGDVFGSGVTRTNFVHRSLEWVAIHTPGDATDDGVVDFKDLLFLSQNYGQFGSYGMGDFNNDWKVGFDDLLVLAQNYGKSQGGTAAAVPVPEPETIALLSMLPLVLCRRRR